MDGGLAVGENVAAISLVNVEVPAPGRYGLGHVGENPDGAGDPAPGAWPVGDIAVPDGVGLCAYRIVQESLSNAGRHAPGAAISVTVEAKQGSVRITVINESSAAGQPGDNGTGHGLAGMRERVSRRSAGSPRCP